MMGVGAVWLLCEEKAFWRGKGLVMKKRKKEWLVGLSECVKGEKGKKIGGEMVDRKRKRKEWKADVVGK